MGDNICSIRISKFNPLETLNWINIRSETLLIIKFRIEQRWSLTYVCWVHKSRTWQDWMLNVRTIKILWRNYANGQNVWLWLENLFLLCSKMYIRQRRIDRRQWENPCSCDGSATAAQALSLLLLWPSDAMSIKASFCQSGNVYHGKQDSILHSKEHTRVLVCCYQKFAILATVPTNANRQFDLHTCSHPKESVAPVTPGLN